MSYFDDASLVMIPSGYKDQKVYSVKPIDGSGDLTFSRASNASRINSSGLVEKVRTNELTYSNDFSNAAWTKPQASVLSGQPDPSGGNTAFKLVEDTSTNFHWLLRSGIIAGAGEYGISIFAKPAGRDFIAIGNASAGEYAYFNLSNGTVVSNHPNAVPTIEAAGNGFYRCSVTLLTSTSSAIGFFISTDGSTTNYTGDGTSGLFIFGAQAENGVTTNYIPTTTAAVSVGPVSGLPRLDYSGGATCPKLLLEGQRTNLITFSEQFDNAAWAKNNATISANSVVSPDGYTNADTYTATGGGNYISGGATSTGSNTITYSVFAKAGTQSVFRIREAFYFGTSTIFNLSTGTVTSGTGTITNYGNGWYRCTHTQAYGAGETNVSVIFDTTASSGTFYLYGAQFEVGAYATSYIPTLNSAVTRLADACSKTGISSLIGQTEGTLFVEFKFDYSDSNTQVLFKANQTTDANSVGIEVQGTTITALVNSGGGNIATIAGTIATGTIKAALAYKTNDMAFYVNGTQVGVDTSGSIAFAGVVDILTIGQFLLNGSPYFPASRPFNQALLFKTRLSNADLATLTTI